MAVTLKDVADLAGVSVKTVSNVVNGHAFVTEVNRLKVQEALDRTGYRPNISARNLRLGRTGFLALVVPELGIPYFGELSALVIAAAQDKGWTVLVDQTFGTRDRERASIAGLGPHVVDGAIISPEALQAEDLALLDPGFPVVLLGEHDLGAPLDHVGIDNVAAARTAVEHLLASGRSRIAAIGSTPHRGTAALRLRGFRDALDAAGLPWSDELVVPVEQFHRRDGALAMRTLLRRDPRPDAVFCFNDQLAVGALHEATEAGLRIPHDLAVIGFDGSDETAYTNPSLSTVVPDKAAIAAAAVDLISHRADAGAGPRDVTAPFRLEVRASTSPA